jgi:exodeoxyribonuclease VIII
MEHITFDLETLGNGTNAPIVQIGAVKFTDDGTITDTFLRNIDLESLEGLGFHIDYNTLSWWFNQSPEAIKSVFGEELDRVSLSNALYQFQIWIGKTADYYYWSHATFDPPILKNNYKAVGKNIPIPFRLHVDIRTLSLLGGKITIDRGDLIHHNALDDCIHQANYISKGLQQLKNKK